MQQRHPGRGRGSGEVAGAVGVDHACLCRVALGPVDIGPGGAVEDRIGPDGGEGALNGGRLGYIELGARQSHELVPARSPARMTSWPSMPAAPVTSSLMSEDRDVGVVSDHEAVGARLAIATADGDVAPEQRRLHAPVEV